MASWRDSSDLVNQLTRQHLPNKVFCAVDYTHYRLLSVDTFVLSISLQLLERRAFGNKDLQKENTWYQKYSSGSDSTNPSLGYKRWSTPLSWATPTSRPAARRTESTRPRYSARGFRHQVRWDLGWCVSFLPVSVFLPPLLVPRVAQGWPKPGIQVH